MESGNIDMGKMCLPVALNGRDKGLEVVVVTEKADKLTRRGNME